MSYASEADLEVVCAAYGLAMPDDPEWVLEQASRDVSRYLGAAWDLADLEPEQQTALTEATAIQGAFRVAQGDLQLGADDNIQAAGPISFSLRSVPRFSPEAAERVAGFGLYARSGTVSTPPDDDAD